MSTRKSVATDLRHLIADTYVLYTKTLYCHWNVTGELFFMLHAAFEKQYEELAEGVDVLAERLRALKEPAPGTLQEFQQLAGIKSGEQLSSTHSMLEALLNDHEHVVHELQGMIKNADEKGDQATMDLMIERQAYHQKVAWMLRSSLM